MALESPQISQAHNLPPKQKQALHGLVGEALKFKEFYASERSSLSTLNTKKPPPIGEGLVFYPRSLFFSRGLACRGSERVSLMLTFQRFGRADFRAFLA